MTTAKEIREQINVNAQRIQYVKQNAYKFGILTGGETSEVSRLLSELALQVLRVNESQEELAKIVEGMQPSKPEPSPALLNADSVQSTQRKTRGEVAAEKYVECHEGTVVLLGIDESPLILKRIDNAESAEWFAAVVKQHLAAIFDAEIAGAGK